jgi:hypothetical protein
MHSGREKAAKPDKRLNYQNVLSLTTTRKIFPGAILSDPNTGSTLAKSPVIPFLLGAYFPLWITPPPSFPPVVFIHSESLKGSYTSLPTRIFLLPSIEYSLKSTQSSMEVTKGRKCVAVQ